MKKGLKVFCWVVLGFLAFCALIATFSDDDSSTPNNSSKQVTSEDAAEQDESVLAIYEMTDKSNSKIKITLNKDETGILEKDGNTYYCSWNKSPVMEGGTEIVFAASDDNKPHIVFDGGVHEAYNIWIKDGWLYGNFSYAKAKNPQWRIKIN